MLSKIKTLAVVAAASATLSVANAAPVIDVRVAPPPPRHEFAPEARAGYVWMPGYWDWEGHHHVWVKGHWQRARHGYAFRSPQWVQEGDHWVLHRGTWSRGDRDHDGIPNQYDRDRDGDHVPNAYDARPNDPRRH